MDKYHAYLEGYSTLPKLKKLISPLFIRGNLKAEKTAVLNQQACFLEHDISADIYQPICEFIVKHHPDQLSLDTFPALALQVTEDLAIHRLQGERDWLAATHVCFPSGWLPEEKIGRNFLEIHQPIPGMNLKNSRKLVEAMIFSGPFERYVWGLIYSDDRNGHPHRTQPQFNLNNPQFYVKVETQIMVGFPAIEAMLFILRQVRIPSTEVDRPALLTALRQMTPEQRKYKNIPNDLIYYLEQV